MNNQVSKSKYQIANIVSFILTIVVNVLANILPINGLSTGQAAAMYQNLFMPANVFFYIWVVIYFALAIFIIYQSGLISKGKNDNLDFVFDIGWYFTLASIANVVWLISWHYKKVLLSLIMMIMLFICLLIIYRRLKQRKAVSSREKMFVHFAFSIYLGWITVATIANITAALSSFNWNWFGISEQLGTVFLIAITTLTALHFLSGWNDIWYCLAITWGLLGILLKHTSVFKWKYLGIIGMTFLCILLITLSILRTIIANNRARKTT
ncbi:MAG TPA: tryptophan-rich sensory protein [Thermoanaerobacterales bacterium]|nr:tryptophan-rich sensory protein [Thermoanaerobacterales bacterium]